MIVGYKQFKTNTKKQKETNKKPRSHHRNGLEQGSANFYKGPNNKYIKF